MSRAHCPIPTQAPPNPITKAAFAILSERWPQAIAFDALLGAAHLRLNPLSPAPAAREDDVLGSDVLQCYAAGLVELHAGPSPFVVQPGERPLASAISRHQAQSAGFVTNLRHEYVAVDDELRPLLCALDGTRERAQLEQAMMSGAGREAGGAKRSSEDAAVKPLDAALRKLARAALLVG